MREHFYNADKYMSTHLLEILINEIVGVKLALRRTNFLASTL